MWWEVEQDVWFDLVLVDFKLWELHMFWRNAASNRLCPNYKFYRFLIFPHRWLTYAPILHLFFSFWRVWPILADKMSAGALSTNCSSRLVPNCADGLVVRWVVAIDSTRVRFPVGALLFILTYWTDILIQISKLIIFIH